MQSRVVEGEKPYLLVVDDDPDMGEFIADVAEMVGYRCTLVADTAHFQTALGPDVVLIT
jgi:DNA-binding response OmpR family regulator